MWIDSSFEIDGQHFGISVKRLDDHDGERLAAKLAWFAHGALTPGVDLDVMGWGTRLRQILSDYVALTVDDETLVRLDRIGDQVICRALEAFVKANELNGAVRRYFFHGQPMGIS